jgi:ERCC4-type nuclease
MVLNPTIAIDTREQKPWAFANKNWNKSPGDNAVVWEEEVRKLDAGDYTLIFDGHDMSHIIAIERKELTDFVNCCSGARERFNRELERAANTKIFYVLIEAEAEDLFKEKWRGKIKVNGVLGSIFAFERKFPNVHIFLAGKRATANKVAEYLLRYWWNNIVRYFKKTPEQISACPYNEDPIVGCTWCQLRDVDSKAGCKLLL